MAVLSNKSRLEMAKEITVAALQNYSIPITQETGSDVSDFFEAIYNKISELNTDEN